MKTGPDQFFKTIEHEASQRGGGRVIAMMIAAGLALYVLSQAYIVVPAGHRAVIFDKLRGVKPYQLGEGMTFTIPILWVTEKYDVKTRTYTMSGSVGESAGGVNPRMRHLGDDQSGDDSLSALTSDGLPVTVDMSVRYHIDPDHVWRLHREIGEHFVERVVRPQSRSVARMEFAEFSVTDVYSGRRQLIVDRITRELKPRMAANYLILDEVLLRDVRFPQEFQDAIEQKQVAQQEAQRMVFEVDRAKSEKQQRIIEAQGEAGAISKKAEALAQNPQLIQYEYVKRLPADVKIVITDGKTIINLGDVLGEKK